MASTRTTQPDKQGIGRGNPADLRDQEDKALSGSTSTTAGRTISGGSAQDEPGGAARARTDREASQEAPSDRGGGCG